MSLRQVNQIIEDILWFNVFEKQKETSDYPETYQVSSILGDEQMVANSEEQSVLLRRYDLKKVTNHYVVHPPGAAIKPKEGVASISKHPSIII
ncbi:hypothetical protein TNCV_2552081 [Trichonephila clavipes]|nr:hypothetical protein TNCV_2552081 [Trichonephila clavipes]